MTAPPARLIWITGRAAAGKSTLIAALDARLRAHGATPIRYHDEQLLLQQVRADTGHHHHWHPHDDHRIRFRTGQLFDQSLRILNTQLLTHLDRGGLALIELARGRNCPPVDVTYRRALQLLDPRLWPPSLVYRLDLDFAEQLRRNAGRTTGTGHGTPDQIMHELYRDDDPTIFIDAGIPITTLPATAPPRQTAAAIAASLEQ